jgi:hypothetical protein
VIDQCVSESKTRTGWIGGIGVEYAIFDNLSLKVEYLHGLRQWALFQHADRPSARLLSRPAMSR